MGRKPTKKDIMRGCKAFFKDMIIAVFLFEFDRAKFDLDMLRITAKGDFEVIDENKHLEEEYMGRRALIPLHKAQEMYGVDKATFIRPRYVPEGACEWCGSPLPSKRRKSCCSEECTWEFNKATCSVMYANTGSAGGYRNHIFRRDNYTCQKCGTFHAKVNDNGIPLPTTDGKLDLHHKVPVSQGGTDDPGNLITLCRDCHKEWHREHGIEY